jgi:hypothetical protein
MAVVQCYDCGKFVEHDSVELRERTTSKIEGKASGSSHHQFDADVKSKVNICHDCATKEDDSNLSSGIGLLCGGIVGVGTFFIMQWVNVKGSVQIALITGVCTWFVSVFLSAMFIGRKAK